MQDVDILETMEHPGDNLDSLLKLADKVGRENAKGDEVILKSDDDPVVPPLFVKLPKWRKEIPLDCGCKCF